MQRIKTPDYAVHAAFIKGFCILFCNIFRQERAKGMQLKFGRNYRARPIYPSLAKQVTGILVVLASTIFVDFASSAGYAFKGMGLIFLLIFVGSACWSGLRAGMISASLIVLYIPVAATIPGSTAYGADNLEQRIASAAIVFFTLAIVCGVVQNKLRNTATQAWDAREAANQEAQERLVAEARLGDSEHLQRVVVDSAMDAIIVIDLAGNVSLWSRSAEVLFGWSALEVLGNSLSELIIPERHREEHQAGLQRFCDTGKATLLNQRLEMTAVDKAGREFEVELSIVAHRARGEITFIGFLRDVSDQNRMKRELMTAQRLESIGQLAGGIARDFNNVLNAVIGFTQLAKAELPPEHPAQEDLDQVLLAGRKSSEINAQLLAFARKQASAPQLVSLNDIAKGMEGILVALIREDVEYSTTLDPDLASVRADPAQIEQVLTNLVINASDAMPHGGRLFVETRNLTFAEGEELPMSDLPPGKYATLTVSDTGIGIPPENVQRVFEPFFSTKEDKGTGLGLASVYGIVKQSGGRIAVYSEVGHGTMFRVYLPQAEGSAERDEEQVVPIQGLAGTETVLIAEDNGSVRALFQQVLERYGYKVLVAGSGKEALEVAAGYTLPIHVLVTDLIMPNMGGVDLARNLRGERPDIKVLFLSGYTEASVAFHGVSEVEGTFLQKPVLPTNLLAGIRDLLVTPFIPTD